MKNKHKVFQTSFLLFLILCCLSNVSVFQVSAKENLPVISNLTASSKNESSLTLKWKKQKNVSGYEIKTYDSKKKSYVTLCKLSKNNTSYTIKNLKPTRKYKYKIRIYKKQNRKNSYGKYSKVYTFSTKPKKPKLVLKNSNGQASIIWNKDKTVSKFLIYAYDSGNGSYTQIGTVKNTKNSYTLPSFRGTRKYKVRAYRKNGSQVTYNDSKTLTVNTNRYTVSFHPNGADAGSMKNISANLSDDVDLPENTYSKTGYAFIGWNTKKDGSGKSYDDADYASPLTSKFGVTITLYAQWKPIAYTVSFDGNYNDSGIMKDMSCSYDKGSSEPVQEVETAKAEKGNITAELETSGTIGSEDMRTYSSPVNAEIATADLQVGKPVKKGESLITFNTASLEKSYNISQLQNKASDAANQKSLEMSAKGSEQAAQADARIQSIDDQLNGLNGQISELAAQTEQSKNAAAEAGNLDKEITELDKRSEELKNKKDLTKEEQKELEKIQKEKNKKQEQRKAYGDVTAKVSELENQLKSMQSQAESLQGSKAEEQSKKAAGEASVLTDAEKQGIASSQQAAKLTLSQSADSLEEAKAGIQAEFDGIVTSTEVAAGSAVQEGAPMFSIADASKMCVDFKVSKYNLTSLQVGQKVTITSLDRKYQGSVTNIGKVAEKTEQGAAMATARVHIDNPDDNLIIGLDAKLKIELGKKTDVLKVPIAAVNSDSKGDFVYVFSKDKLQKKYVKTGISYKKNIEIIEGLKEGEKVVTTIDTTIEDGMKAAEKK